MFFIALEMALGGADCIVKYNITYIWSQFTFDISYRPYFDLICGDVRFTLYFTIRIVPEVVV